MKKQLLLSQGKKIPNLLGKKHHWPLSDSVGIYTCLLSSCDANRSNLYPVRWTEITKNTPSPPSISTPDSDI